MSLPSPDGSTSSVVSSEDSTSSTSSRVGQSNYYNYNGNHLNNNDYHHHMYLKCHLKQQQHQQKSTDLMSSIYNQEYSNQHQHNYFNRNNLIPQLRSTTQIESLPSQISLIVGTACNQYNNRPAKICGVCGDRAKSYHFGGISCDSCKAFFRRSVQNDAYKNFHCPYDGQCDITIMSRKCCQHCRFKKCLSIGMEKSWVMTEEERLKMLKSRLEKKQKQENQDTNKNKNSELLIKFRNDFEPEINKINDYLTDAEINQIESIINQYSMCCNEISFSSHSRTIRSNRNRTEILEMFLTAVQQFALFAQRFDKFKVLPVNDQEILLRASVLELCFLRGAFLFDLDAQCWPISKSFTSPSPYLLINDLESILGSDLIDKHMKFIRLIKSIETDEITIMLLSIIILLTPDRSGLLKSDFISEQQEYFLKILRKYMNWRFSECITSMLYPKLLLTLPELRELADGHTEYHVLLCKEELEEIQYRLGSLHLDTNGKKKQYNEHKTYQWTFRGNFKNTKNKHYEDNLNSNSSDDLDK